MNRVALWLLALCLGFAGLSAHAACPESGGIGGTGKPSSGGIGGTGKPAAVELGLIGVVRAAGGTLCVNGVELEVDAATRVTADQQPVDPAALAPGQVVVVSGSGTAQKARASQIDIVHAVTGPASAFEASSGVLHIGAQRVHVGAGTVVAGMSRSALGERPSVRVSGLWRADGSVEATRIEPAPRGASAAASSRDFPALGARRLIVDGFVRSIEPGRVDVGGLAFEADARTLRTLRRDERVRLDARVEDGRRIVERAEPVRATSAGPARRAAEPDPRSQQREAPAGDRGGNGTGQGAERGLATDGIERGPSAESLDRNSGPGRVERAAPERLERSGPDRPERVERNSAPDRPERVERSAPERPEPATPERPDRGGGERGGRH